MTPSFIVIVILVMLEMGSVPDDYICILYRLAILKLINVRFSTNVADKPNPVIQLVAMIFQDPYVANTEFIAGSVIWSWVQGVRFACPAGDFPVAFPRRISWPLDLVDLVVEWLVGKDGRAVEFTNEVVPGGDNIKV